jgi:peptidoglycan/xylan/chitin deacetylase (PgdA/CDA1 family)
VPILCYHSVDDTWESPLAVRGSDFAHQCAWLRRHRTVVDVNEAARIIDSKGRLPRRTVALTFDDGFADNYDRALPVLQKYRIPAMVFVVAETIRHGQDVDWVNDPPSTGLRVLDRDQILEMADSGIAIGSHSLHHRTLTDLSPDECLDDLRTSREILEDLLGRSVDHLAYPRGSHDAMVRAVAARAGYSWSFSLPQGPEEVTNHALPRVGIFRDNGRMRFRAKLSERYLTARTSPLYRRLTRR